MTIMTWQERRSKQKPMAKSFDYVFMQAEIDELRDALNSWENQEQVAIAGLCAEKAKPGGCQLHNLHCGYPACDTKPKEED